MRPDTLVRTSDGRGHRTIMTLCEALKPTDSSGEATAETNAEAIGQLAALLAASGVISINEASAACNGMSSFTIEGVVP